MLKEVRIDTMYLVATLNAEEKEEVYNNIRFNYWHGNKSYRHILHNESPNFMVYFEPVLGEGLWLSQHYNVMIQLQHEAIKQKPAILNWLMNISNWRVKRLDIAFDWNTPMSQHLLLKHPNTKPKPIAGTENYYLYGLRNQTRIAVYDKKKQLKDRKGIEIPDEHLTRIEIRIQPKLTNQPSLNQDLSWIKNHLQKCVFVEDASGLSRSLTREEDKNALRKIRRRKLQNWTGISRTIRTRIRKKAKEQAANLYELFQQHDLEKDIAWQEQQQLLMSR